MHALSFARASLEPDGIFLVRDDRGHGIFEIRGRFFHIGDNLVMHDRATGQELVEIKQRLISLRPSYDIYRQGQHWANVHEQIHLFGGERFKVQGENGMVFHIQGNLWTGISRLLIMLAISGARLDVSSRSSVIAMPSMLHQELMHRLSSPSPSSLSW